MSKNNSYDPGDCRICPGSRPARLPSVSLCEVHYARWKRAVVDGHPHSALDAWCAQQKPLRTLGTCVVAVCHVLAMSPLVLSGADLLYWRRKRDQWRSLAERAPDDATADYLDQVFAPTAQAIEGLERALAGLGLLQDALALDLRRPQDFFQRVWSTAFRVSDLAALDAPAPAATLHSTDQHRELTA
ncbi:hypothetical protein [Streptomyces sp. NPDC059819]|uniref:hypothetical protein n=1 Tax=Streptomyces sp. NPDC059819 TaxID=3346963 RepID=UPI00364DDD60